MIKHIFPKGEAGVGHWTNNRIKNFVPPKNAKIVDLACGQRKIPGAIGLDKDPVSHAQVIADATKKLPFDSNSLDMVFCLNFLEHTLDFDSVLSEIYRILKPKGILHVEVPYYNSFNHSQIPFHRVQFCETTMENFYTKKGTFARYSKAKFKILETELYFTKLARIFPKGIRIKCAHYISNLCYQIYWKLQKDE
ncbi:class I SAM-dependent methyltransferase [Candidatus Micrarchaeota archaeon]|nr:class I SAM-dependent methyltransferase [Candidatus Micrarchaeota archaeon]